MRRRYLKMNITWDIVRLVKRLYGRRLLECEATYTNDEWGMPIIKLSSKVDELNNRMVIIQVLDRFSWNIKSILYVFNLKPYKQ